MLTLDRAEPGELVRSAGTGVLAFAALGLVIASSRRGALQRLDHATIARLPQARTPATVRLARSVSWLAEPGCAAWAVGLSGLAVDPDRRTLRALTAAATVASGAALRRAFSRKVARARPPTSLWLIKPEGFSLPSKHTTTAALTAGACAACFGTSTRARHLAVLLTASAVGASRICLGVHWPSDVLAGWLFAEGWLGIAQLAHPSSGSRTA